MSSDVLRCLRLDLTRALSGGLPHAEVTAPTWEDLTRRDARAAAIGRHLLQLRSSGQAGFSRLDAGAWGLPEVVRRAAELKPLGDCLLVLGIGGSALGARALRDALRPLGRPRSAANERPVSVEILDSLDPEFVRGLLDRLDPQRTVVAAISKSGTTLETVILLKVVQAWLEEACPQDWAQRLTFVTDPERGALRTLAEGAGVATLPVPSDVGGRFSVLTAVGMLPAAFLGLDIFALLGGAGADGSVEDPLADPAWRYATLHDAWWAAGGRVSALLSYRQSLASFGAWFQQLWAESLGKRRSDGAELGWTPLALRGPAAQHSFLQLFQDGPRDKLVTSLRIGEQDEGLQIPTNGSALGDLGADLNGLSLSAVLRAEEAGTVAALVEGGRPVVDLMIPRLDEAGLGALFGFFQRAVAYAGLLWDIDPFDQPGVEAGKRYASAMLGREGFAAEAADFSDVLAGRD
jgi:glucose-6-phosphate isomerase